MASAALALELVFFALAFGLRSLIQYRRTGSTGLRLPSRDAGAPEWIGSLLFAVALVLIVAAPIAVLAGLAAVDVPTTLNVLGLALAVAGSAVTIWAQLDMGDSWRVGVDANERTELVTRNIYRVVRNPIFSAMVAAAVGLALTVPSWISLLAVLTLVVGLEVQVRLVEEPYLAAVHGDSYDRYCSAAGRFAPRIGVGAR